MNRNHSFLAVLITSIFIFSLFSCDFGIPKKIVIKAKPTITIPSGDIDVDINRFLTPDMLNNLFAGSDMIKAYPYMHDNDDEALRYMLMMNMDVPLGDSLNFEGMMEGMLGSDGIKYGYDSEGNPEPLQLVPDMNMNLDIPEINLTSSSIVSSSLSLPTQSIPVAGDVSMPVPLTIDMGADFQSITYGSGCKIDFAFSQIVATSAKITQIKLTDGTNPAIISDTIVDLTDVSPASTLILADKTLKTSFQLILNVEIEGATPGTCTISGSCTIPDVKKITGFTKSDLSLPIGQIVDLGTMPFKQATVAADKGSFNFNLGTLPANLSVTSTTFSMTQSDDGAYSGLDLVDEPLVDGKIDLGGRNLNSKAIDIDGNITIEANNATITFPIKLAPTAGVELEEFSTVLVDSTVFSGLGGSIAPVDLTAAAETVSSVTFNKIGLKVKVRNGLPFDIDFGIKSDFIFGDTASHTSTFLGNSSTLETDEIVETNRTTPFKKSAESGKYKEFDLAYEISAGGGLPVITMTDVIPGQEYYFCIEATPVLDWKEAVVKIDSTPQNGNIPGLDLSMVSGFLGDEIRFGDIKTYGFLSSELVDNGALSGISLKAKIGAGYTDPADGVTPKSLYLVGTSGSSSTMDFVHMPNFTPNDDGYIVAEMGNTVGTDCSFYSEAFTEILNDGPTDMSIDYEIQISGADSGITVSKAKVASVADPSINFRMVIDFPFTLEIPKAALIAADRDFAQIDLMDLIGKFTGEAGGGGTESDLFGRTDASGGDAFSTIANFLESCSIDIDYTNKTGLAIGFIMVDGDAEDSEKFKKEISFIDGTDSTSLDLTMDDAQYIMSTVPFRPDKMIITIPGSQTEDTLYTFKRNAGLSVNVHAVVKTNINYEVNLSGN